MDLKEKCNCFAELCGDWDFRNIDMTEPHLSNISIQNETIYLYCEIFSNELDDYVSCYAGACKDQSLIKMFHNLDLNNASNVDDYIDYLEMEIDWKKIKTRLYSEEKRQLRKERHHERNEGR